MNWPLHSIGEFCLTGSGGTPSRLKPEYFEGSIPWIKSGDLRENVVETANEFITEDAVKNSSAKIVSKGAILVAMYGATVGRMAILGIDAATNQAVCNVTPNEEIAFQKYVYYALLSKVPEFLQNAVGGAQPNISQGMIRDTKIPLPPLEEQKRIAAILDKAESIRRKRQEAIELGDEFLRALFLDMFGDPVTNTKGWKVKKWGDAGVIKIINGRNQSQVLDADGKYPIIGSGGEMGRANDFLCPENTIVIGRKGNINKPLLVKEKFWNVDTAFGLVPNLKELSFNYLYWFCVFFDFERLNKTVTIPSLTKSDLLEIWIPLPDISIQNKFDNIVEKINTLKANQVSGSKLSNNSFNALSNRLFNNEN